VDGKVQVIRVASTHAYIFQRGEKWKSYSASEEFRKGRR